MADTNIITQARTIQVTLPGSGQTASYRLTPDALVRFTFDLSEAEFIGNGNNLEIIVEGGGKIILEDYLLMVEAGTLPAFEMAGGEMIDGSVYMFAFESGDEATAEDLETAADAAGTGSGAGAYSDDPGTLFDGLDALGGQGDAYDTQTFTIDDITPAEIEEEAALIPPVAVDDVNSIKEDGWNRGEGENGHYEQEGPYGIVEGNLLLNDFDGDNIDYPETSGSLTELSVNTIDFPGADFTGNNPGAVPVSDTGTQVNGLYGTLTVFQDGSYEYELDQTLADPLRESQEIQEQFAYTVVDPDGNVSNTATLTINVIGTNDAPDAFNDLAADVIEQGTEVEGIASVSGNVLHNDSDVDNIGYEDLDPGYRDLLPTDPDGVIELGVTSIYSYSTYQYDSSPTDGVLTVDGRYGTLTINVDGSYEYTLDQTKADPLNIGDEPVEVFSYSMWDGDKYDYAILTVPVFGSNDAPKAAVDVNDFTEAVDDGLAHAVSGNVLSNDTDVDNVDLGDIGVPELTVTAIEYSGEATPPARVSTLYVSDHIIEGEFGTLYLNDDGSYVYVEDKAATDPLNSDDDPVEDVFTYEVSDNQAGGALTDTATLTITITGANDSPVANLDVNSFTEAVDEAPAADVFGNLLTNDTDIDNPGTDFFITDIEHAGGLTPVRVSTAYVADHVIEGQFGTLYLNDDGSYHYVEDKSSTDWLNSDDTPVKDVFNYEMSDGALTDTATLTITITGANDTPVADVDVNRFTEAVDDAAAGDVSGNVLTNDTDVDNAHIELSVSDAEFTGDVTPPVRVSDAYVADHVIEGQWGTLYLNDDGSYHYVEDKSATDPLNIDDDPVTDVFTYEVTDNQTGGALSDTATLTITIDPANDTPVAVHDGSHELFITRTVETVIDDWSNVSGSVIYGPGYTVTAAAFDLNDQPIQDVQFTTWGNDQHLGIYTNGSSDDQKVDDLNGTEQISFEFDDPQSAFSIEFIAHGSNHVNAWVYPIGGGDPVLYTNVGNSVYITPGFEFDTIVFIPDGAFGMESLTTVTGGETSLTGTAEGNVLANDYDVDNVTFDDATAAGDMSTMEHFVSDIDSANVPGNDPIFGTDGSGDYFTVDGEFGALKIYETGEWSYTPFEEQDGEGGWQNLEQSSTDVFEYTVSDGAGGTDTASIEVSLNLNATSVSGDGASLLGSAGNDVLFPTDGQDVSSAAGHDAIVIDPAYLGDDASTLNILDFSDSDRLVLGNMEGASVSLTTDSDNLSLVFSDIDGSDDITVNLLGVTPVNDAVDMTVEITTSDDLNALIQSVIDSGNDSIL